MQPVQGVGPDGVRSRHRPGRAFVQFARAVVGGSLRAARPADRGTNSELRRGGATVLVLSMNAGQRLQLRGALLAAGLYPQATSGAAGAGETVRATGLTVPTEILHFEPSRGSPSRRIMRTSRPTRDLKLFLPVASLCAGALLLGRLPEQQGLAGHQKLMRMPQTGGTTSQPPFHANHAHPSPGEGSARASGSRASRGHRRTSRRTSGSDRFRIFC